MQKHSVAHVWVVLAGRLYQTGCESLESHDLLGCFGNERDESIYSIVSDKNRNCFLNTAYLWHKLFTICMFIDMTYEQANIEPRILKVA